MAAKKKTAAQKAPPTFEAYLARVAAVYTKVELTPPRAKKGASASAIAALERKTGHALPAGLRAAWLSANGAGECEDAPVFFPAGGDSTGYELMSVPAAQKSHAGHAKLAQQYEKAAYKEPSPRDKRIAPGWFLPGWLPFAEFGGGSLRLLVDFTPSARGTVGQVIAFTHDPDEMTWVAVSFDAFLAKSLAELERDPEGSLDGPLDRAYEG